MNNIRKLKRMIAVGQAKVIAAVNKGEVFDPGYVMFVMDRNYILIEPAFNDIVHNLKPIREQITDEAIVFPQKREYAQKMFKGIYPLEPQPNHIDIIAINYIGKENLFEHLFYSIKLFNFFPVNMLS